MTKSRFPDSLVLILAMVVLAQVATLVLPAGEFARDGRSVLPGTYERLAEHESSASDVLWILPDALMAMDQLQLLPLGENDCLFRFKLTRCRVEAGLGS